MVTLMGLWNFRLLGSTVTMGDTAPPCCSTSLLYTGNTLDTVMPTLMALVRERAGK